MITHVKEFIKAFFAGEGVSKKGKGPTENWTQIFGFKVLCAHHCTIGPLISEGECNVSKTLSASLVKCLSVIIGG